MNDVRTYTMKDANTNASDIENALSEAFGPENTHRDEDTVKVSDTQCVDTLSVTVEDDKLIVNAEWNSGTDNDTIKQTVKSWNRFLREVLGTDAKTRKKQLKKAAQNKPPWW